MNLSKEELNRYSRHILLAEVGIGGQQKLKEASVLVIGAGGLGCPALLYLTAAGVGTIGIIDPDVVDSSNLQRQVLYKESDIGKPKVRCAQRHLSGLNPFIDFKVYQEKFVSANAIEIIRDYDLVIDGSDNFATRYLVNDACVLSGKPFVYGALHRFSGQISVFNYQGGPTYRCLFPEPPAAGEVPSCAEAGVVGVLPGMIGTFQASEAIKIICGFGEVASGKLVTIDALSLSFNKFNFKKDVNAPPIQSLIDYDAFCGTKAIEDDSHVEEVSVEEFRQWQQSGKAYQLVDVREKAEYEIENINGQLIPLSQLTDRLEELDKNEILLVHCQSGARSRQGSLLLLKHGFKKVYNLTGGMNAWKNQKQ